MPRSYEPHEFRDAEQEIEDILELDGEGSEAWYDAIEQLKRIQDNEYSTQQLLERLDKEEEFILRMGFKIPGSNKRESGKLIIKRVE